VVQVTGQRWHKAFELYAHITWATRLRVRFIAKRHVPIIANAIRDAAERHRIRVLSQAILADHVHVLVSFRPDCALMGFVRDAKSESSRRAETVTWSRGYYAGTVSWRELDAHQRYIGRQYTHHPQLIPS
jgi:REP element-mobilizing transposase RayT